MKGLIYMRLKINKSKNSVNYYIITDFKTKQGKRSTKVFKKLGNEQEILKISEGLAPLDWAKKQLAVVNQQLQEKQLKVSADFYQSNIIEKNKQLLFNCGYFFLQDIYYSLGLDKICKDISDKYRIKYDLNSVLSNLIYTRIIEPSSKLSSFETAKTFLEQPNFELQNIYRALEIIANETEFIESAVYKNSLNVVERNTNILYYDRIFNNIQERSFIVTQSLKKIKGHLKDWALSKEGQHKLNSKQLINLNDINNSSSNEEIYYKERQINENDLSQRLIVSYSPKYAAYQKNVRNSQIERVQKLINSPSSVDKNRQNDPKRFLKSSSITADGEIADKKVLSLNQSAIDSEIIKTLRNMNFLEKVACGYVPTYTRTDLTDALHQEFDFRTDTEIISKSMIKKF